ncbi:MAG: YkgJ family cysteine cluster protein [Clostridium sp.]
MITSGTEFIERALEDKVTDLDNPRCNNCNECCSYATILTEEEFKALKKFISTTAGKKIYQEAKRKHKAKAIKYRSINFMCPFSSKTRKCMIYNLRPKVCRDFHCKESLNKLKKEHRIATGYVIGDLF